MNTEERNKMMRNKVEFIKGLQKLLIEHDGCQTVNNIQRLEYVRETNNEWLYLILNDGSQKRVGITGSSHQAILREYTNLIRYWDEHSYINSDEDRRYEKIIATATFYSFGSKCHVNS